MKRNILIFLILFMFVYPMISYADVVPGPVEDKITGEADLSFLTAFIFRGKELTRNSAVIQPSVTVSYEGFSSNIFGNFDTNPYSTTGSVHSSHYTETDYTLSYSKKFGILQVTPGYIYYDTGSPYKGGSDVPKAQELFLTLGLDTILSPTFTAYKEIDHYRQWYFLLGVSHTVELDKTVSLKCSASVSYLLSTDASTYSRYDNNSHPIDEKFNNFHDGVFSLSLPIVFYKSTLITPILSYVFPLSDDARYEMKAFGLQDVVPSKRGNTYLYGGITLSYTF